MSKLPILNIPEFSDERPKMMSRKSFVDWPKSPMTEISRLSIVNSKDSELLSEVASLVKRESTVYPGEPDRPTHMLSRESYLFLKKLLLEEGNFDSPQLFEIEEKLRSILLGAGVQDDEPLLEMVQGVENGTRAHTSHAKMTPVAIKKIADELIKSENKPVNLFKYQDAESMLPPKKEHLGLPDVESEASSDRNQSFLESRPMSVHTEAPKEVALEIEQTFGLMAPPRATTRFVIESMKEIFGDELIVPPAISATPTDTLLFTPVHVGMAPLEAPEPPNKFYKAIRKLVHEIKANIPLLQMADTNTVETGFWSSIIESDFTRLTKAPEVGSPNAEQLMKAAKAAMIQEVCPSLQYEACRLLIDSDLYTLLGRWDMYQFNQLLKVIPSQGTEDQKDSVAVYNALNGNIDKTVVDQLHKALDSHDHQRRKLAKAILSEMDGCFGELVIPVLLELGQRESWRTKMDILELFRAWIPKLIPERPPKPALRDPDALDSDSPELIKALFNTLGNFTFSQEKNEKEEIAPSKLKFETVPDFLKPKEYVDEEVVTMDATKTRLFRKCVHSLLVMMWEDHSSTVRKTATDLLAHFRQGKAVYDYIILMLSSPDPIKRANALVSLQTLEIITKDDMPSLLQVFQDAYASVRTEACKFAAILKSHEPQMISALLDQMSYPDESVRCQALRALSASKFKDPKVKEALNWAMCHDPHWAVRIDAIRTCQELGLVSEETLIKDSLFTVLALDPSDLVKRESERVLVANGLMFTNQLDDGQKKESLLGRNVQMPYQTLMQGVSQQDMQIMLRDNLIGDSELKDVTEQLKQLGKKSNIMEKVEGVIFSEDAPLADMDLDYHGSFKPKTHFEAKPKTMRILDHKLHKASKEIQQLQLNGSTASRVQRAKAIAE